MNTGSHVSPSEGTGQPDASLVLAQLDRILASPQFTANDRRRAFLRYVIEESLAGRADRIKGFSVAMSVFGRNETFDSGTDPVVRLEARKLRRELEHFYLTDGREDPLIITIPKGSYVPSFEVTDPTESSAADDGPATHRRRLDARKPRFSAGAILAIAAVVVLAIGGAFALRGTLFPQVKTPAEKLGSAWSGLPVIAVMPFEAFGESAFASRAASGLTEDVITDLTRIQGLRVIAHSSTFRYDGLAKDLGKLGAELGATHVLHGSLQTMDDGYRLNVSLTEIASRQQIWAERFDYTTDQRFETQTEIARRISAALSVNLLEGQSSPIEGGRWASRKAQILYKQALTIVHPPSDPSRVEAAIMLLNRVVELEPNAAHGYGGLAFVESHRLWYGHVRNSREARSAIEELAARAISIDPANARALIGLSVLAMIAGAPDRSVDYARRATEAQPSSSYAHTYLGLALIFAERPTEAIAAIKIGIRLDPANARRPYLNILAAAQFHAGDYQAAIDTFRSSLERQGPYDPIIMVYHAASYAALGRESKEHEILRRLRDAVTGPGAFSVEGWLRLASRNADYIAPLLDELEKAKRLE